MSVPVCLSCGKEVEYICWHCVNQMNQLNHPNYVRMCPFCGSFVTKDIGIYIECDQCHARGPAAGEGDDCKALWNRRVP